MFRGWVAVFIVLTFAEFSADAYCHLKELKQPHLAPAFLVSKSLNEKVIYYCYQSDDYQLFPIKSLAIQIEFAIGVWLSAVPEYDEVELIGVPCSDSRLDLLIFVGRSTGATPAYQELVRYRNRLVNKIVVDTSFIDKDTGHRAKDTKSVVGQTYQEFSEFLDTVSYENPMTTDEASDTFHTDPYQMWNSTYPILLHEVGHAFGLADMYRGEFSTQCDQKNRSRRKVNGRGRMIMNGADQFYLGQDDYHGIRSLFKRFAE